MQTESMRERQLNVRLSREEWDRFDKVAQYYGVNAPTLVRMLVVQKARELGLEPVVGAPPPPPSRPRRTSKKK